jgi:hypothetical protein
LADLCGDGVSHLQDHVYGGRIRILQSDGAAAHGEGHSRRCPGLHGEQRLDARSIRRRQVRDARDGRKVLELRAIRIAQHDSLAGKIGRAAEGEIDFSRPGELRVRNGDFVDGGCCGGAESGAIDANQRAGGQEPSAGRQVVDGEAASDRHRSGSDGYGIGVVLRVGPAGLAGIQRDGAYRTGGRGCQDRDGHGEHWQARQLADSAGGRGNTDIQRLAGNSGNPHRVTLRAEDGNGGNGSEDGRIEVHHDAPGGDELRRLRPDFDLRPATGGSGLAGDLKGEILGR